MFGQSWLSFWENGALIGAGGVFIAIIAEFPEILEKFGRLPKWLSKERAKKIEAIAWAILLFGIGVETVAGQIARIIADEEIATLNGEASQAWLEVELLKTPRAITSMQSDILLHTLNPLLLKEQICVHADPSDGEAVQYAGQLAHALNNTGAQVVLDEGIVAMLIPSGKVSIVSGPDGLLDKQRQVVFDALKAAEIKVGVLPEENRRLFQRQIFIAVGGKFDPDEGTTPPKTLDWLIIPASPSPSPIRPPFPSE